MFDIHYSKEQMRISGKEIGVIMIVALMISTCAPSHFREEIQITTDLSYNHDLDNNDNFSPDDRWLVYDMRNPETGIGACPTIEKVNVETGETRTVYEIPDNHLWGPGVGAASYSHTRNAVIFIHGLSNITEAYPYQQWRRTGVMVKDSIPGVQVFMDARDVTFPFTPGALRGGTHRHEWRRDDQWIGYTYNDAIMKALEDSTGVKHNLRTIGVSKKIRPVTVDADPSGENLNGTWFNVLVVRVVPNPNPGSDEISHASSDSWVGVKGYQKPDGTWQAARAFLGNVVDKNGRDVEEVFVVDIPDRIDISGEYGPLEGTKTTFPMPPKGTVQRRLTFTANSHNPGCEGVTRSSADGQWIAYQARDKSGIKQVFLINPKGGEPWQLTQHTSDVQSGVRWSPNGKQVCYVWDNSVVICDVQEGSFASGYKRLTVPTDPSPKNLVWSHNGKMIAYNREISESGGSKATKQIFVIKL